jgi:hypothetical protein
MHFIRRPIEIIKENKNVYFIINAVYYGLVILGMIIVSTNPELQKQLKTAVNQEFTSGPLSSLGEAYTGGKLLTAMALTFLINLLFGTFLVITLPSAFIPFFGLLMGVFRATMWGLVLSPSDPDMRGAMIPHSLTLLIEGQAYIVAMLAVYLHGKSFLFPKSAGMESHWSGYKHGLKQTAWLYAPVVILLAVAAVYEAFDVILLVPLFK